MYPKRLILDDARNFGIRVLGLDVNASADAIGSSASRWTLR
jgi:error-prone DNA polymerase